MSAATGSDWFTLRLDGDAVLLLDQRRLPHEEVVVRLETVEEVASAIETMVVRGAPAIGCTAALGVALAAVRADGDARAAGLAAVERLARTRPTAVNLFVALRRMRAALEAAPAGDAAALRACLVAEAQRLVAEDVAACRAIGAAGLAAIPAKARVLTHCNAGALATAAYGTALGVVRAAHAAGRIERVYADETRPFLQGARLTAWELARDGIPVTVIADGMAGHLLQRGEVDVIVVGADRIAANGDVANKIGTYPLAVLAREHGVPFYVAAPLATVDLATPDGAAIPIEERGRDELARIGGVELLPPGVPVRHPAFDVTPHRLVTGIVTERGIVRAPFADALRALCDPASLAKPA